MSITIWFCLLVARVWISFFSLRSSHSKKKLIITNTRCDIAWWHTHAGVCVQERKRNQMVFILKYEKRNEKGGKNCRRNRKLNRALLLFYTQIKNENNFVDDNRLFFFFFSRTIFFYIYWKLTYNIHLIFPSSSRTVDERNFLIEILWRRKSSVVVNEEGWSECLKCKFIFFLSIIVDERERDIVPKFKVNRYLIFAFFFVVVDRINTIESKQQEKTEIEMIFLLL